MHGVCIVHQKYSIIFPQKDKSSCSQRIRIKVTCDVFINDTQFNNFLFD